MNGILVVDKPTGCTSHDVVQKVRRALKQRSVGHAGTLDPLATGVLVIAIGEATKLVSHLQSDDKKYEVEIALGAETDTLDAEGNVVVTSEVPHLDRAHVEAMLESFLGRHRQTPPAFSAIKVEGTPLHRRARRGEEVEPPVREVELHAAELISMDPELVRIVLHCGKGFYVRSFARDLARALGTVGHVRSLRRVASGAFSIEDALAADALTADTIGSRLIPLREACGALPRVELDEQGAEDARHGRPIRPEVIVGGAWRDAAAEDSLALFGPNGEPVALGRRQDDRIRIVRGFKISP